MDDLIKNFGNDPIGIEAAFKEKFGIEIETKFDPSANLSQHGRIKKHSQNVWKFL